MASDALLAFMKGEDEDAPHMPKVGALLVAEFFHRFRIWTSDKKG